MLRHIDEHIQPQLAVYNRTHFRAVVQALDTVGFAPYHRVQLIQNVPGLPSVTIVLGLVTDATMSIYFFTPPQFIPLTLDIVLLYRSTALTPYL